MERRPLLDELLLESAASLRMAERIAGEHAPEQDRKETEEADHASRVLQLAHTEIVAVQEGVRQSRDILRRASLDPARPGGRLRDVSSAAENATRDVLDALDRALLLLQDSTDAAVADKLDHREHVCNELYNAISSLQFQDITAQQLSYAADLLEDVGRRLELLAGLLDRHLSDSGSEPPVSQGQGAEPTGAYDPAATMDDAQNRQALADEIFYRS